MTNANEINVINANNFQSTKASRDALLSKLNTNEQKMFKTFVKSLGVK